MSRKSRGTAGERDLIHKFWAANWAALRAAGSGSTKYPCPDLLVGNSIRKLAIEVKITTEPKKYLPKEEVEELVSFARTFGAEAWIAVRFFREPWRFLTPEDMEDTGVSLATDLTLAERRGLTFEELVSR
jgi:Holliday junction resolvase